MIHQNARTGHESSSALGQHIHDTYPKVFDWMDVDGVIFKKSKKLMRIVEHKEPGKTLSESQKRILPILAIGIQVAKDRNLLHPRSGVYVVWSSTPFLTADVSEVLPVPRFMLDDIVRLDPESFAHFKTGEIVWLRKMATA